MRLASRRRQGEGYSEYIIILAFIMICSIVGLLTAGSKALKKINIEKGICSNCPPDKTPTTEPSTPSTNPTTPTNPSTPPTTPTAPTTPVPPVASTPWASMDPESWDYWFYRFLDWF